MSTREALPSGEAGVVRGVAGADIPLPEVLGAVFDALMDHFPPERWQDLRQSHYRVLYAVGDGGITVTELASRLAMTKQASGQFVTALTASGHLDTASAPGDRRLRLVHRTAAGDRALGAVTARMRAIEQEWATRIGAERYATFRAVLSEIVDEAPQHAD